jgi:microcystin-dependent protein
MPLAFVGEIRIFAGSFPPTGWAFCNGQLMSASQNTALFSILGYAYGGSGSTFALPDLQGRAPMACGQGPGLTPRVRGQALGSETHPLILSEIPNHTHPVPASSGNGVTDAASGSVMARSAAGIPLYAADFNATMAVDAISATGDSQPHNNMQPYVALNFIICLSGVFPSRWP